VLVLQAWQELDSIQGGWQWLCQGPAAGNELVRCVIVSIHTYIHIHIHVVTYNLQTIH
jgi:hypothetical protein